MADEAPSLTIIQHAGRQFLANKYTTLFLAILMLFLGAPLLENKGGLFLYLLFLIVMLAVLRALQMPKGLYRFCLILAMVNVFFQMAVEIWGLSADNAMYLVMIGLSSYTLLFGIAVVILTIKIFSEANVTKDTVQGGIAVYFLMGILWAFFYQFILLGNADAISLTNSPADFSDILYFSFTTLTTLGYGDNLPVSALAKNLTVLESSLGQIFLTVLIARLVGLHLNRSA